MEHDPAARLSNHWEEMLADMEATAGEYRERGWEAMELHPGDVTAVAPREDDDRFGLDVLVPGNEFDELEARVEAGASFDAYRVFRAEGSGLALLLVAMEDDDEELAVLFPAYFDPAQSSGMRRAAESEGRMYSHVRPLDRRNVVTFEHDEPALFFGDPDGE